MYKMKLQELCHRKRWSSPIYSSVKNGPDHNPRFKSSVSVNGLHFHSSVSCRSSKESQNDAAKLAFLHFTLPPSTPPCSSMSELLVDPAWEIKETPQRPDINHSDTSEITENDDSLISGTELTAGGSMIREMYQGPEIQSESLGDEKDVQCRYKSLLQNYAQHNHLDSPQYSSTKKGPAHAPCFKATVTVDGHTFESIEFFKSLKQAEHAAAKVALTSLACDELGEDNCAFYKSLLHELTQKKKLPVSLYQTVKCGAPHMPKFFSMVEVEGEVFYGKAGRSRKEAEMKAAKVAYIALMERGQSCSTGSISRPDGADGTPTALSSDLSTVDSQNLDEKCIAVSSPVTEYAEDSKAELAPVNIQDSSNDFIASPTVPSTGNLIAHKDILSSFHAPASPEGGSLSFPPIEQLHLSALSFSDSSTGKAAETDSYLLCNRVRVYSCIPDIAFPKGITVMPICDNKWVAVSLEFPNEGGN